jgi:hypothetical protein
MFFQERQHAEGLFVVFEVPALFFHPLVQRFFAAMAEGRVPQIMRQRDALNEIFIETERPGQIARNLRHFHRMRQPRAHVIIFARDKDLRLSLQTPEGCTVDDAVAIALKRKPNGVFRLTHSAPQRSLVGDGEGREEGVCLCDAVGKRKHGWPILPPDMRFDYRIE